MNEEAIFATAIAKTPEERGAFLNDACGSDQELRARVEALLEAHDNPDSFLDSPAGAAETTDLGPVTERPGTVIGSYKLREQIGEGGMGVVFVAEQQKPVRRKVALKVIKPGMDTKEVVARFEAERQALAMMDHPNIAKVLDAGSTDSGRPYFVMELVHGIPITEYCDRNKLTVRERLELFVEVCAAIQHAHQKGIIHRDVKPTNVLVTLHDGKPVPKVIDFGVAKAINQRLAERTIYTRFAQIIGTPTYMSPEQAELSGLDIDTRSDIYSLGVLLYELLTGATPFDKQRLEKAAYDEIRRIIREEEPPKPSTKVSRLGETGTVVSEHRRTDPNRLRQQVRGDLDWIVMKALEKDRTRRYETASGFAADVTRYLSDEPVEARAPSTGYRIRKFVRRNRGPVVAFAAVVLVLIAGVIATTSALAQARKNYRRAEDEAENARENYRRAESTAAALEQALKRAKDQAEKARRTLAQLQGELIDRGIDAAMRNDLDLTMEASKKVRIAGASPGWVCTLRGLAHFFRGELPQSIHELELASTQEPDNVSAIGALAIAHYYQHDRRKYNECLRKLDSIPYRSEYAKYDALFRAWAELFRDPAAAESRAREATRNRHWALGYAIHAATLAHLALDSGRARDARAASDQIRHARALAPDNPFVLMGSVFVNSVAIGIARETSDEIWAARLKEEADAFVTSLNEHKMSAVKYFVIGKYYQHHDEEKALEYWREYAQRGMSEEPYWALTCKVRGFKEALSEMEASELPNGPYAQIAHGYMLAVQDVNRGMAEETCYRVLQESQDTEMQIDALQILLLLGELDDVEAASAKLLKVSSEELDWPFWRHHASLEYLCGTLDERGLLDSVGSSRIGSCRAHYQIAMKVVGRGDRDRASKHFCECADAKQFNLPEHYWAQAFLAHMKQEASWPDRLSGRQAHNETRVDAARDLSGEDDRSEP